VGGGGDPYGPFGVGFFRGRRVSTSLTTVPATVGQAMVAGPGNEKSGRRVVDSKAAENRSACRSWTWTGFLGDIVRIIIRRTRARPPRLDCARRPQPDP